jgi:hypothetical protein
MEAICENESCKKELIIGSFIICMKCRMKAYCSEECLNIDKKYHKFNCFREPVSDDPGLEKLRHIRDNVVEIITDKPIRNYLVSYNLKNTGKQTERFVIKIEIVDGICTAVLTETVRSMKILDEDQKIFIERYTKPRACCNIHLVIRESAIADMFDVIEKIEFQTTETYIFPECDETVRIKEILTQKIAEFYKK